MSTVKEVCEKLQEIIASGYGDYDLVCGFEYDIDAFDETINDEKRFVNLPGSGQ